MDTDKTGSLSRGLHIIGIMAENQNGLSLKEIAHRAGLSKSSTHRLLHTLMQEGFVLQDSDTARYRLGLKLLSLAGNLMAGLGLDQLVRPLLEDLSNTTRQTVHLALWDSSGAVYAQKIDAPSSIRMYSQVGKRVPMHCTGVGKAMLAFLPEEKVKHIIATAGLPGHTRNTITDAETLFDHLRQIRVCGYALDREEHEEGIRCIAAPLLTRQSQVLGAVSITALAFRVDEDTLFSWWPQLRDCAQKVAMILEQRPS